MISFLVHAAVIGLLLAVLTLTSYVDRLYSESGKFLSREFQENIDAWEALVEPRLGMTRTRAALSAAVWSQLSLAILALYFGALLFAQTDDRPRVSEVAQALFGIVLVVLLFNRFLPLVFFKRTRGIWLRPVAVPLRVLFIVLLPVTVLLGFLISVASLANSGDSTSPQEHSSVAVDALIEAGEEEGILEESDRELVRSAVEFGDKVARLVMTPRPEIFAVPATMSLAEFKSVLETKPYSRVPVYSGSIDNITGLIFAHDLLQVKDTEAASRTVASLARPAAFVPETKNANELLREMQREKQHMRIVIDEYGGVAGLVTIEDLLEEIVGTISDEHEEAGEEQAAVEEIAGAWVVPGSFEIDRLPDLFGEDFRLSGKHESTTIAGLVSEAAGHIPMPGEVVEADGLRLEVLASTGRRVEQVRMSQIAPVPDALVPVLQTDYTKE